MKNEWIRIEAQAPQQQFKAEVGQQKFNHRRTVILRGTDAALASDGMVEEDSPKDPARGSEIIEKAVNGDARTCQRY